ncbi:hypothetical protein KAH55_13920, partial [bacterium]|nr:hypothetical protein [bacterium]
NEDQSVSYVKMRTNSLLDAIWAFNPDITVILSSIIPRTDETHNAEHEKLAPLIESLVEEKEDAGYSVRYCPMYEFFTNYSNWNGWMFDDMHPNNNGYNAMARAWYKQITDVVTADGKVIADNFNRKSLVGYWTSNASYGINGYQMENQTENSDGNIAVLKYKTDPKSVSFSYGNNVFPGGSGTAGLALRLSEGSKNASGYAVVKDSDSGDLVLSLIEHGRLGAEIDRISGLYDNPVAGDTLRVAMYSDLSAHYFECYLNGRFEGRLVDVGRQQGNNGDQHAGLLLMGTENNRVDNFTYSWDDVVPYEGPSRLEMVSGDLNTGIVAHAASQPLVVRVEDFSGASAVGFPVAFSTQPSGIVWTEGGSDLAAYEMEQSGLAGSVQTENADSVSAGAFIHVTQTSDAEIELRFEAQETGTYQFWVRTLNSSGTPGSFQVRIDDATEFSWLVDPAEGWDWQPVSADGAIAAGTFDLSAGLHLLHISGGFVDAGLDRLILSSDPGFTPQATRDGSPLFYSESSGEVRGHLIFAEQAGAIGITAFLPDYSLPEVHFDATAEADIPETMLMVAGNNQVGKPTELLPLPLQVKITDQFDNPVPDIAVRYETTVGDAIFEEVQPVMTNENGIAETVVRLGVKSGNQGFQALCEGYGLDPVLFAAIAQKTLFSISGQMLYWANGQPIPNVSVVTSGDIIASDTTTVDGVYAFRMIPKHTDFSIAPEKELSETEAHVTVDLYNAAFVMRAVLGLEELNAYQQLAADVDQNYQVESYDAANIARFVVELPPVSSQIRVGEWAFTPGNQSYSNITVDLANKNFTGMIIGDVVGRYETNYSL